MTVPASCANLDGHKNNAADCHPRRYCIVKPLARRVVQKSLSEEEEIKTPFAIMKVRSANCI